ncbi:MAG TPA: tetratricopeptide repeat protein [Candidatus Limnocylindrales bacterium]
MMLEAERALAVGLLDQAERLYRQVLAADPNNAIAVVGLARVALERGDERTTYVEAKRALAMDPDNPMASHLAMRMTEILRGRGESLPDVAAAPAPQAGRQPSAAPPTGPPVIPPAAQPEDRAGFMDRILRRRR